MPLYWFYHLWNLVEQLSAYNVTKTRSASILQTTFFWQPLWLLPLILGYLGIKFALWYNILQLLQKFLFLMCYIFLGRTMIVVISRILVGCACDNLCYLSTTSNSGQETTVINIQHQDKHAAVFRKKLCNLFFRLQFLSLLILYSCFNIQVFCIHYLYDSLFYNNYNKIG